MSLFCGGSVCIIVYLRRSSRSRASSVGANRFRSLASMSYRVGQSKVYWRLFLATVSCIFVWIVARASLQRSYPSSCRRYSRFWSRYFSASSRVKVEKGVGWRVVEGLISFGVGRIGSVSAVRVPAGSIESQISAASAAVLINSIHSSQSS